jgi:transposase
MRKGIDGLAMLVQAVLRQDPFSGHLFVFRGRKCSGMALVCACSPSGSNRACSCGHRRSG